jgi:hypothetical protein
MHVTFTMLLLYYMMILTAETPNKGHFGKLGYVCCPFYGGCPLFRGSKCIRTIGKLIFWDCIETIPY